MSFSTSTNASSIEIEEDNLDKIQSQSNPYPINEVKTNTFVINLQQAIFGLETGSEAVDFVAHKDTDTPFPAAEYKARHFLTGTELSREEIQLILSQARAIKQTPKLYNQALANKSLVMIFEKPSFRTRLSFALAIQSMGGIVVESISNSRKQETPADMVRVLNGYADFVMVRTHDDKILQEMAEYSKIPLINGLSALHHPCQILADLLSLEEQFGALKGLTLTYIGDGNNVLHSLMLLAPQLGVTIHYCCPKSNQPDEAIVKQAQSRIGNQMIHCFDKPEEAVKQADAVYTDVWTSMGFDNPEAGKIFKGFQVNETLMSHAKPDSVFMHCMPMERGKEVSATLPDSASSIIFRQSENRMHVQKALMLFLDQ
ncbi:TPA: ornithine carbamoyltransferase [Legionella pneumophila]|uniref:ornithine carbamoyltransferase n=1 Tax=Legionella pneumophila TaxID=446 RepID=UPI0009B5377B|nr:ornithine carbamoyltransferase [Legionella pneumophila]MDW8879603.1 ornithine carbamoyltransferase [Legionella pneumophila subsp. fraseri]MDW8962628.1 ornithine carbamoyltransferase [Legionella pneumophila subsp. fraseri]MDW9036623.1 ornithine carbamoyltransferase [Legionella pneumophila subsp. fraseri]MDW9039827.1 ornithine carbamoyltransferase [Legionella pneumophila subsp. fraseri]MDW9042817.1 ornithine carbamoyltransferase [Legionella pneumophila subsp. fraseri]